MRVTHFDDKTRKIYDLMNTDRRFTSPPDPSDHVKCYNYWCYRWEELSDIVRKMPRIKERQNVVLERDQAHRNMMKYSHLVFG